MLFFLFLENGRCKGVPKDGATNIISTPFSMETEVAIDPKPNFTI
jgi:hypothetical protein